MALLTALLDANILYPAGLRDVLLRLADQYLYAPLRRRWHVVSRCAARLRGAGGAGRGSDSHLLDLGGDAAVEDPELAGCVAGFVAG